jgi:hypothetical protein
MRLMYFTASLLAALALIPAALAGPAAEASIARVHHIAAGDVGALAAAYAPEARLHWVGGPLDGIYEGEALSALWRRFAEAMGPLDVTVGPVLESANPNGATVSVPMILTGAREIKVRYTLVYREGLVVDEVWQIDPHLQRTW